MGCTKMKWSYNRRSWRQFGRELVYPVFFEAKNPNMTLPGPISEKRQKMRNTIFDSKKCLVMFCLFCLELGPGSVIFGFFASNYTGYTNSRPNWRQESLFYDHLMIFTPRSPSTIEDPLEINRKSIEHP